MSPRTTPVEAKLLVGTSRSLILGPTGNLNWLGTVNVPTQEPNRWTSGQLASEAEQWFPEGTDRSIGLSLMGFYRFLSDVAHTNRW